MNTAQQLTDYAAARGYTLIQSTDVLLTLAMDYLNSQRLTYSDDPVPEAIEQAQLVAAMLIDQGNDLLAPQGQRVLSERVDGAVAVTYSDKGRTTTAYPQLESLLAPYRARPIGFMQIEVTR